MTSGNGSLNGRRRVVVTGLGAVTPLGLDVESTWSSLLTGGSGAGEITQFDHTDYPVHFACEVKDFDPTDWIDRSVKAVSINSIEALERLPELLAEKP